MDHGDLLNADIGAWRREYGRCPECGAKMLEVDRARESGMFFLWLECAGDGCLEQNLITMPARDFDVRGPVSNRLMPRLRGPGQAGDA